MMHLPLSHRVWKCVRQRLTACPIVTLLLVSLLLALLSPYFGVTGFADDAATTEATSLGLTTRERTSLPFEEPEKVVYRATWVGIPVAEARIISTPVWQDGKKFYAAQVKAKTLPYLDLFFRMRDTIQSVIDADTLKPHRFVYKQEENDKTSSTTALYNPVTGKWTLNVEEKKRVKRDELDFTDTLDPIAASYLVRSLDFKVGDQFGFMVFVGGKRRYPLTLKVLRQEMIAVGGHVFDAYKIISRVELPGNKNKPTEFREAQVWLSSDKRRILLRATSQVLLGSFTIEMTQLESGKPLKIRNLRI
jgi:hypothetical protein